MYKWMDGWMNERINGGSGREKKKGRNRGRKGGREKEDR